MHWRDVSDSIRTPGIVNTCRKLAYHVSCISHANVICRISSRGFYDNMGESYDLNRITDADGAINMKAYQEYSPLYLSCVLALLLYLWTMLMLRVFVIAWHSSYHMRFLSLLLLQPLPTPYCTSGNPLGSILAEHWKNNPISTLGWCRIIDKVRLLCPNLQELRPINIVPEWWYACIFGISLSYRLCGAIIDSLFIVLTFIFACICVEIWHTAMSIWALFIALLIGEFTFRLCSSATH
jgi:hypothetical protein